MSSYLFVGRPGHGKSLATAKLFMKLLRRNMAWFKRTGKMRLIYSNMVLTSKWSNNARHSRALEFIRYWSSPMELIGLEDIDVIWDEIARHLDSRNYKELNDKIKTFVQEHDKMGINIYANTQRPNQVDVMFRSNCEDIWRVTKWLGSRRPSPTRIPSRWIWGICILRRLKRESFSKEESDEEYEVEFMSFPRFMWISKYKTDFFDTRQRIIYQHAPLEHILQFCKEPGCKLEHNGLIRHK